MGCVNGMKEEKVTRKGTKESNEGGYCTFVPTSSPRWWCISHTLTGTKQQWPVRCGPRHHDIDIIVTIVVIIVVVVVIDVTDTTRRWQG